MEGVSALAVVVVAYAVVASKLDRWRITGPMVFVAAGTILGPGGLNFFPLLVTQRGGSHRHRVDAGRPAVRRRVHGPAA